MITIYGIKNCDTMKKAMNWLKDNRIEFQLHDYKKQSIDETTLTRWVEQVGFEVLVNKRGTTWRKLDEQDKADLTAEKAIQLMQQNTSLIKRPVLDNAGDLLVGFDVDQYQKLT